MSKGSIIPAITHDTEDLISALLRNAEEMRSNIHHLEAELLTTEGARHDKLQQRMFVCESKLQDTLRDVDEFRQDGNAAPMHTMAAIEHQLQCLLGQHLTQSAESLTATAKLKQWQQQMQRAEMGLLTNRGNRQMRLDAVKAEQLQLEQAQLRVKQAGRSLERVQVNKSESKARLNGVILQERIKLKALQEDLKDIKLDIAEGSRQTVKLKAVSASLPNLQIEVEDRAKRQALLVEQQQADADLAALTAIRNKEEKATSEVMRGKINCASHNIQQMSAAAAAKAKAIAALKAHLQQDVDKQDYISMLKTQIDAAQRMPRSVGVPEQPFVEGREDHEGRIASTLPCGEIKVHPAQAHKQAVLASKATGENIDFLSCQGKEEAADTEHDAEEDGDIWQIGSALH